MIGEITNEIGSANSPECIMEFIRRANGGDTLARNLLYITPEGIKMIDGKSYVATRLRKLNGEKRK